MTAPPDNPGDKPSDKVVPLRKEKPCPLCGKPPDARFRPFCSKRCADRDLGQWLGEGYRVPGAPVYGTGKGEDGEDDETP